MVSTVVLVKWRHRPVFLCKVPDGLCALMEAVVTEQVGQENGQKPVKRIAFRNEQEFHEKWEVPKV